MTNVNPAQHRGPSDRDASQGFTAFEGAVAVVTGGSSGIGLAIGKALCNLGCQVVLCSRDAQKLQRAADEIGAWGLPVDVAERSDMQKLAETVLERFGKVNILCNNAGVGPAASFVDLEVSDWRWMLDVNLWGVIHGLEAFLPAILTAPGGGAIVNTSSQAVFGPVPGLAAYRASKAAVLSLTESLRLELAQAHARVSVTSLLPGPVHSEMNTSLRHRRDKGALVDLDIRDWFPQEQFLDPSDCASMIIEAIRYGDPYVVTHPELTASWEETCRNLDQAIEKSRRDKLRVAGQVAHGAQTRANPSADS